jgi:glycosyltransferase involved in cell wall biosynthesis
VIDLKIILISPLYPPHIGGVEFHVSNLATQLRSFGNEVQIVTSLVPKCKLNDHNVVRVPAIGSIFDTPICPSLLNILRDIQADLIHIHLPPRFFPEATMLSLRLQKKHIPVVITNHAPVAERIVINSELNSSKKVFFEKIFTVAHNQLFWYSVHKNSQKIIVQGKAMEDLLYSNVLRNDIKTFSEKIHIIPNAVDEKLFNPAMFREELVRPLFHIKSKKVILYVGRLAKHKGVDYLIKALSLIKPEFHDLELVIAGSGSERQNLEALSIKMGIHESIKFLGDVPHQEIPSLLYLATILVHPSFYEGIPTVVLEAMSMEKPVIVADSGCMPEVIENGKTGFVVKKGNALELAQAMRFILSDSKRARTIGKAGRASVKEKYTWDVVTLKHINLYKELLQ